MEIWRPGVGLGDLYFFSHERAHHLRPSAAWRAGASLRGPAPSGSVQAVKSPGFLARNPQGPGPTARELAFGSAPLRRRLGAAGAWHWAPSPSRRGAALWAVYRSGPEGPYRRAAAWPARTPGRRASARRAGPEAVRRRRAGPGSARETLLFLGEEELKDPYQLPTAQLARDSVAPAGQPSGSLWHLQSTPQLA